VAEACWIAPAAAVAAFGCCFPEPAVQLAEDVVLVVAVAAVLAEMAASTLVEPRRRDIVSATEVQAAARMAGAGAEFPPGSSVAQLEEGAGEQLEGVDVLAVVVLAVDQAEFVETLDLPAAAEGV
jgi:hypothetical protein